MTYEYQYEYHYHTDYHHYCEFMTITINNAKCLALLFLLLLELALRLIVIFISYANAMADGYAHADFINYFNFAYRAIIIILLKKLYQSSTVRLHHKANRASEYFTLPKVENIEKIIYLCINVIQIDIVTPTIPVSV